MAKKEVIEFSQPENNKVKYKHTDLIKLETRNPNQRKFIQYYYDQKIPLIFLNGFAGTGKTFLALHAALNQVLDESTHYERILIVRSAVESGQPQGFLPGDMDEKNAPYELPYKMLLREDIFLEENALHFHQLKMLGKIDFGTVNYLRGVTLKNTIIIVEEIQNMDYQELHTVITRFGKGSRVILTGDICQNDLERKRKTTGLPHLLDVLNNMPYEYHKIVEFEKGDIVRDELVKQFIISDYNTEEKPPTHKK